MEEEEEGWLRGRGSEKEGGLSGRMWGKEDRGGGSELNQ